MKRKGTDQLLWKTVLLIVAFLVAYWGVKYGNIIMEASGEASVSCSGPMSELRDAVSIIRC